ncbi:MAG: amino acid permease [Pseudomonadota bacterium]|nr:amino acid permease [Pseudomonadota bacterium]
MNESEGGRQLGFWMCLALVVGNMIGSGIFLLPANLAPLGLNAIWGWIITIGGAMCLAAVFAALAKAIPEASGPYDYVAKALGSPPAFLVMWAYWISIWVTNSAIAIAAVSYLSSLAPGFFAAPGISALTAIAFVALFTGVACTGARTSGRVQILTSILKIMPLVAAMVIALIVFGQGEQPAQFAPAPVSPNGVAAAAALTLWAMLGFECASVPAGRVRDPARTIPRATMIGTLAVGLIYLAASSAVFLLLPADVAAKSPAPFADLVGSFWGPTAATLVVFFAAISCLGALNGWVLLQGEVPLSLARRGVFPRWFGKVNSRGMPVRAQILGSTLSALLVAANFTKGLTELFAFMALLATVATLVLYLFAALSALRLMAIGQLRSGFMLVVTLVGGAYAVWTFYGAGAEATLWGLLLLMTAIPVWFGMRLTALWSEQAPERAGG